MSKISMGSLVRRLAGKVFGGGATVRKPIRRRSVRLGVEALEERWCPTTYTWTDANYMVNNKWSNGANWLGGVAPAPGGTALFDGSRGVSSGPEIDSSTDVNTNVTLKNGYNKIFTVDTGVTFNISTFTDSTPATDSLTVKLTSNTSGGGATLQFNGEATLGNVNIYDSRTGTDENGVTKIAYGATVTMGNGASESIAITDSLIVSGTLNIGDTTSMDAYSTVHYNDAAGKVIDDKGTVNFFSCNTVSSRLITNGYNGGTLNLDGSSSALKFLGTSTNANSQSITIPIINGDGTTYYGGIVSVTSGNWDIDQYTSSGVCFSNTYEFDLGTIASGTVFATAGGTYEQYVGLSPAPFFDVKNNATFYCVSSQANFLEGSLQVDNGVQLTEGYTTYLGGGVNDFTLYMGINKTTSTCSSIIASNAAAVLDIDSYSIMNLSFYGTGTTPIGTTWNLIRPFSVGWITDDFDSVSPPAGVHEVSPGANPYKTWSAKYTGL